MPRKGSVTRVAVPLAMSHSDVTQYQADREKAPKGSEWVLSPRGSSKNECIPMQQTGNDGIPNHVLVLA
jgi:hypothetical protein